ncbi:DUF5683 domain-containing protein [Hymenobacter baengnokdamensis]|uniref:DUF5683 domain-containing protein n=1 Tax=Hymenobacter baengnokdamensis TaxID=2615203 RepID=UPI001246C956|nr:DUF5683 domain-containing protein [Hymenobacter baengnokdamensis]
MKNYLLSALGGGRGAGWALGLLLLLAGVHPARAQFPTATNPQGINPAAPVVVRPDTATVRKVSKKEKRAQAAADSAKRTERLFGLHVTRPQKAGLLALVPGAGQIYNHKYWKLPIVYGMVGGLGYWVSYQARYYGYYKYAYYHTATEIQNASTQIPDVTLRGQLAAAPSTTIYNSLVFSRRYLDLSILLSALGYSLQILDAVVDAHLYDFDVSDNLSLNMQPALLPIPGQLVPATGLALTLRVK